MLHVCTTCNAKSYKSCSSTSSVIGSAQRLHGSDRAAMCICTEQQCSLRSHLNADWHYTSAPIGAILQYNFTLVLKSPAVILVQLTQNSTEDHKHHLKNRHSFPPKTNIIPQINKLNSNSSSTKAFSKYSILKVLKYLLLKQHWSSQCALKKKKETYNLHYNSTWEPSHK